MREEVHKKQVHVIDPVKFSKRNPDMCIDKFRVNRSDQLGVTELAPALFKLVRKGLRSEQDLLQALVPSKNFEAIHNFETGSGKSPSFFFFSDDNSLLIKTLKKSELEILLKTDFLVDYAIHLVKNPDSILSRFLGLYEIDIGH